MMDLYPELDSSFLDETIFSNTNTCSMLNINDFNALIQSPDMISNNYFRTICVNIRSCRKNFSELKLLINSLCVNFDVISLVETWLDSKIDCDFNINGYRSFNVYRNSNGGGIKIFVRNHIKADIVSTLTQVNPNFECLFLELEKTGFQEPITFGCVYRIPSSSINEFNDTFFHTHLSTLRNKKTIIVGNLNVNLYNMQENLAINDFVTNWLTYHYRPMILYPTRLNARNNPLINYSLLDHVWTNINSLSFSSVLSYELTDHLPITCQLQINNAPPNSNTTKSFKRRQFTQKNLNNFILELELFVANYT